MPLKARSTTGRVWPEHVSGVCFIAMAPVGREQGAAGGATKGGARVGEGEAALAHGHAKGLAPGDGTDGTRGRIWEGERKEWSLPEASSSRELFPSRLYGRGGTSGLGCNWCKGW